MKIIKSATEHPPREFGLRSLSEDVVYRRKPLTYAYSGLASLLARLPGSIRIVHDEISNRGEPPQFMIGDENCAQFMTTHKLLHGFHDPRNLYALIAEHCKRHMVSLRFSQELILERQTFLDFCLC